MRAIPIALSLALVGCGTPQVQYEPKHLSVEAAQKIVEQVFMEQPAKVRPQDVSFTDNYILLSNGYLITGKHKTAIIPGEIPIATGKVSQLSKDSATRLYYSSLDTPQLFDRDSRSVVFLVNHEGRILNRVYISNKEMARQFIDAIDSLKTGR